MGCDKVTYQLKRITTFTNEKKYISAEKYRRSACGCSFYIYKYILSVLQLRILNTLILIN